jgi:hypothetical protein
MAWGNKDKKAKKKLKKDLHNITRTPYTTFDVLEVVFVGMKNTIGLCVEYCWVVIVLAILWFIFNGGTLPL